MLDTVDGGQSRLCNGLVHKVDCIYNLDAMRCLRYKALSPIVFEGHSNDPSLFATEIP